MHPRRILKRAFSTAHQATATLAGFEPTLKFSRLCAIPPQTCVTLRVGWENANRAELCGSSVRLCPKLVSHYFGRPKLHEVYLAQSSDHLSISWAAGGSHLLPGCGVHRSRRKRQLDHTGFPGAYFLDLYHAARNPRCLKFNCGPVISQVRSVTNSLWL